MSKNDFKTRDLRMVEFSSHLNPQYDGEQYTATFTMRNGMHINDDTRDGNKLGSIRCSFELCAYVDDPEHVYASIKGTAIGQFSVNANTSSEEFQNMLRLNGILTILPMIRSSVYSISHLLTIKVPMIIPNLDVTKLNWNE